LLSPLLFVVIPTYFARANVVAAKTRYVARVSNAASSVEDATRASSVWEWRNLPFGMRNVASATLIYLIFPTAIVVLATVLKA
jgi:hypothetical protein